MESSHRNSRAVFQYLRSRDHSRRALPAHERPPFPLCLGWFFHRSDALSIIINSTCSADYDQLWPNLCLDHNLPLPDLPSYAHEEQNQLQDTGQEIVEPSRVIDAWSSNEVVHKQKASSCEKHESEAFM